jgi:hypothetical protein
VESSCEQGKEHSVSIKCLEIVEVTEQAVDSQEGLVRFAGYLVFFKVQGTQGINTFLGVSFSISSDKDIEIVPKINK